MSASIPVWPRPHLSAEQREIAANLSNPDFSLTRLMQDRKMRLANGDAQCEAEQAAAEAQKTAELEAQKLAEAQYRAKLERETAQAEAIAKAQDNIQAIRERAEQSIADHQAARRATVNTRPVGPGELAHRMASIQAARKS